MKHKTFKTIVPLFRTFLKIVVVRDVAKYQEKKTGEKGSPVAFTAWINGELTIVIPNKNCSIGLLAHEVIHASADILEHHGVKWGKKNQEPLTYLAHHILNWASKVISKSKTTKLKTKEKT